MRTRVKFCGITNETDLRAAVRAGADAIGFNLFSSSSRYVEPEACAALLALVPAFVTRVVLVVNAEASYVRSLCDRLSFDLLQFHGDEDEGFCRMFDRPYIKALRIGSQADVDEGVSGYPSASALMFDARVKGQFGGTGATFDWHLAKNIEMPLILAGGLDPDNVGAAIRTVRPWAVDVSSGIESEPGRKDPAKMQAFARAVVKADGVTDG